ncbi:MAG: polysaccharide pyruvyl transferase family protein [Halioglobus sp.]|nr:polysaccharide pyruvyl transferase family protein [Halioglobus sp.]
MRVSILTQPLGHNYGGLLQAYALQVYLASIGCEVEILDRRAPHNIASEVKKNLINLLRLMSGRIRSMPTKRKREFVFSNLVDFRDRYLSLSKTITSERDIRRYYQSQDFDVLIVGSDQVWRPRYSPSILNYYLDFLDDVGSNALRISYAASFGVDKWEYNAAATTACQRLLSKFDAVSVREESGVSLCSDFLGFPGARCVVDPTLLLEKEDYSSLIESRPKSNEYAGVLVYMLNVSDAKRRLADQVANSLGVDSFSIKPDKKIDKVKPKNLVDCQYPAVEDWLQSFRDASFVVTDSFHGCVFAIIFNKPFVALDNPIRGTSRISSLLRTFRLEKRLVASSGLSVLELLSDPIDWKHVNSVCERKSEEGKLFLRNSIGKRDSHG